MSVYPENPLCFFGDDISAVKCHLPELSVQSLMKLQSPYTSIQLTIIFNNFYVLPPSYASGIRKEVTDSTVKCLQAFFHLVDVGLGFGFHSREIQNYVMQSSMK